LGDGTTPPQERTLTYNAGAGTVVEQDYQGVGLPPNTTFPGSPTRTRTLLTDSTTLAGIPFFRYYALTTTGIPTPSILLPTPLSAADRARAVKISVSFLTRAAGPAQGAASTTLQTDVFLRNADPTNPGSGVKCT